jgi:peptidoglycan L-alanyl-D-glutamate endopeptidase CwlK
MTFTFGGVSKNKLTGVHPDLVACAERALSYGVMDFSVAQGVRTEAQQAALYQQGRSTPGKIVTWTMKSNHLLQSDGYGHALDLVPFINGKQDWDNHDNFVLLATLMFRAAMELGFRIGWGGHWTTNKDLPHFEVLEKGA